MAPNPDCFVVNFTVAVQTVVMVLLNTFLMGVIFARFSSPMHRTQVIQFSRGLAMHVHGDRMCLSCRVANLKAHGMMNPHVRMVTRKKRTAGRAHTTS